jgi:hypothetical protein
LPKEFALRVRILLREAKPAATASKLLHDLDRISLTESPSQVVALRAPRPFLARSSLHICCSSPPDMAPPAFPYQLLRVVPVAGRKAPSPTLLGEALATLGVRACDCGRTKRTTSPPSPKPRSRSTHVLPCISTTVPSRHCGIRSKDNVPLAGRRWPQPILATTAPHGRSRDTSVLPSPIRERLPTGVRWRSAS